MKTRNWTYLAGRAIAAAFLLGALAASYTHIVHLFHLLGTHGWQAWTAPAFIDGFALLGRLARSKSFAEHTRRRGLLIQITATSVSFVANVVAGETWGDKIFGAMVVGGYVVAELISESMQPVAVDTEAEQLAVAAAKKAAASQRAKAAAATRKANAAAKADQEDARRERARLNREIRKAEQEAFEQQVAMLATAPVSPAPYDARAYI